MRISLTRRGGFAGLRLPPLVVDTTSLKPGAASELQRLVSAAIAARAHLQPPTHAPAQPDRFSYSITVVSDDGSEATFAFDEATATPPLTALVEALLKLVRN